MERKKKLSETLKRIQKERGLSLSEFAKDLDIPKSTLQYILKTGDTSLDTFIHISDNLKLTPNELLGYDTGSKNIEEQMNQIDKYSRMTTEDQEKARYHVNAFMELFKNDEE